MNEATPNQVLYVVLFDLSCRNSQAGIVTSLSKEHLLGSGGGALSDADCGAVFTEPIDASRKAIDTLFAYLVKKTREPLVLYPTLNSSCARLVAAWAKEGHCLPDLPKAKGGFRDPILAACQRKSNLWILDPISHGN